MLEKLYRDNIGLLYKIAGRYSKVCTLDRAVDVEDLVQSGFFGLVRAAQTYDPEAGKSWVGWAAWHIHREMQKALGIRNGCFTKLHTGADSLDRPLGMDSDETTGDMLRDTSLPEVDAALCSDVVVDTVHTAIAALGDDLQRQAVELIHLQGKSIREAAHALGKEPGKVSAASRKAFGVLRKNRELVELADLDGLTRFYAHKGVSAFQRDWTSVVEEAVLWRDEQRRDKP